MLNFLPYWALNILHTESYFLYQLMVLKVAYKTLLSQQIRKIILNPFYALNSLSKISLAATKYLSLSIDQ